MSWHCMLHAPLVSFAGRWACGGQLEERLSIAATATWTVALQQAGGTPRHAPPPFDMQNKMVHATYNAIT